MLTLLALAVLAIAQTTTILTTIPPPQHTTQQPTLIENTPATVAAATVTTTTPSPHEKDYTSIHPRTSKEEGLPPITDYEGHLAVRFLKHLISILDTHPDPQIIANNVREEFQALNIDGRLGAAIHTLLEIEPEDMLVWIRNHGKLRHVLDLLRNKPAVVVLEQ
jgi:hypothetical protein